MTEKISRLITGMLIFMSCLACLTVTACAASSISILPSVETVVPGEEFTLDISVRPDTEIAALQLDIEYDASLLTIESIEEGDLFANTGSPVMFNPGTIDNTAGTVSQIYGTLIMGEGTSEEGNLCRIKLVAAEDTGSCNLRIKNVILGDTQGNELDVITFDSLVSISDETESSEQDEVDETELNIIKNPETETKPESEADINQNTDTEVEEETTLQSTPEIIEENDAQKVVSAPEAESDTANTPNVSIVAIVAIAFLALAYILDRKRK